MRSFSVFFNRTNLFAKIPIRDKPRLSLALLQQMFGADCPLTLILSPWREAESLSAKPFGEGARPASPFRKGRGSRSGISSSLQSRPNRFKHTVQFPVDLIVPELHNQNIFARKKTRSFLI